MQARCGTPHCSEGCSVSEEQREEKQMLDSSTPGVLLGALVLPPCGLSPWTLELCPVALCAAPVQACEAQKVTPPSLSLLRAQQPGKD